MKAWLAPIGLGILVAGVAGYSVVGPRLFQPTEAAVVGGAYVQGLKRAPGTWQEPTISVGAGVQTLAAPDVTIDVQVMRPVFVPSQIRVKQGQVVKLRLIGKDDGLADMPELQGAIGLKEFSGHGFQILGPYDVWVTGIRKGVTREVVFKATTAGEFAFECVVFCSPHHYAMQGMLIVEPAQ